MNFMKKVFSVVIALALFATLFTCVYATDENVISAVAVSVKAGEAMRIPVTISGNTGIKCFSIIVTYNPVIVSPVSVTKSAALTGTLTDTIASDEEGSFELVYTGTENFTDNGTVFELEFATDDSRFGSTQITLSYVQEGTCDDENTEVVLDCRDIAVSFIEEVSPESPGNDDPTFVDKITNWLNSLPDNLSGWLGLVLRPVIYLISLFM